MTANELAASVIAIMEAQTTYNKTALDAITGLIDTLHAELSDIRDGLVDLDHAKATRRQFEELWTRIDRLEGGSDDDAS